MFNRRKLLLLFLSAAFFLSGHTLHAFEVEGTIRMNGSPKPRYGGVNPAETGVCGGMIKPVEEFVVGPNGELKNAVVWVEESFTEAETQKAQAQASAAPISINQTGCQFEPRVVLVPMGGEVLFHSSDPTMHHVAGYSPEGKNLFEVILNDPQAAARRTFTDPGPHLMRCGFHPWMGAVVFVRRHPFYAVTDQNGKYRISNLPRRAKRILVWHEVLGIRELKPDSSGRAHFLYYREQ